MMESLTDTRAELDLLGRLGDQPDGAWSLTTEEKVLVFEALLSKPKLAQQIAEWEMRNARQARMLRRMNITNQVQKWTAIALSGTYTGMFLSSAKPLDGVVAAAWTVTAVLCVWFTRKPRQEMTND